MIETLKKNIEDIDIRSQETERVINEINQLIEENTNGIKIAEERVLSIKSECEGNFKIIKGLREKQQESKEKQEQASEAKKRHAKFAERVEEETQPLLKKRRLLRRKKRSLQKSSIKPQKK